MTINVLVTGADASGKTTAAIAMYKQYGYAGKKVLYVEPIATVKNIHGIKSRVTRNGKAPLLPEEIAEYEAIVWDGETQHGVIIDYTIICEKAPK